MSQNDVTCVPGYFEPDVWPTSELVPGGSTHRQITHAQHRRTIATALVALWGCIDGTQQKISSGDVHPDFTVVTAALLLRPVIWQLPPDILRFCAAELEERLPASIRAKRHQGTGGMDLGAHGGNSDSTSNVSGSSDSDDSSTPHRLANRTRHSWDANDDTSTSASSDDDDDSLPLRTCCELRRNDVGQRGCLAIVGEDGIGIVDPLFGPQGGGRPCAFARLPLDARRYEEDPGLMDVCELDDGSLLCVDGANVTLVRYVLDPVDCWAVPAESSPTHVSPTPAALPGHVLSSVGTPPPLQRPSGAGAGGTRINTTGAQQPRDAYGRVLPSSGFDADAPSWVIQRRWRLTPVQLIPYHDGVLFGVTALPASHCHHGKVAAAGGRNTAQGTSDEGMKRTLTGSDSLPTRSISFTAGSDGEQTGASDEEEALIVAALVTGSHAWMSRLLLPAVPSAASRRTAIAQHVTQKLARRSAKNRPGGAGVGSPAPPPAAITSHPMPFAVVEDDVAQSCFCRLLQHPAFCLGAVCVGDVASLATCPGGGGPSSLLSAALEVERQQHNEGSSNVSGGSAQGDQSAGSTMTTRSVAIIAVADSPNDDEVALAVALPPPAAAGRGSARVLGAVPPAAVSGGGTTPPPGSSSALGWCVISPSLLEPSSGGGNRPRFDALRLPAASFGPPPVDRGLRPTGVVPLPPCGFPELLPRSVAQLPAGRWSELVAPHPAQGSALVLCETQSDLLGYVVDYTTMRPTALFRNHVPAQPTTFDARPAVPGSTNRCSSDDDDSSVSIEPEQKKLLTAYIPEAQTGSTCLHGGGLALCISTTNTIICVDAAWPILHSMLP